MNELAKALVDNEDRGMELVAKTNIIGNKVASMVEALYYVIRITLYSLCDNK